MGTYRVTVGKFEGGVSLDRRSMDNCEYNSPLEQLDGSIVGSNGRDPGMSDSEESGWTGVSCDVVGRKHR
jgi:hypothetical protein